jgi:flagellar biosynthesis/type III secretory pathway M-ring protein FliF/YscJ
VDVLAVLLVFVVLFAAVALVIAPLRRGHAERVAGGEEARREELEAAKEAKYREIRDAEMDFRTGKLSEADYRGLDRQLRAEAVEILRRQEELDG